MMKGWNQTSLTQTPTMICGCSGCLYHDPMSYASVDVIKVSSVVGIHRDVIPWDFFYPLNNSSIAELMEGPLAADRLFLQ